MKKRFVARVIKGKGRGGKLGIRTLNLRIPKGFDLKRGVWRCWVSLGGRKYKGLLHHGPRLTFGEKANSLEVLVAENLGKEVKKIKVEVGEWVRGTRKFKSPKELKKQAREDWGKQ